VNFTFKAQYRFLNTNVLPSKDLRYHHRLVVAIVITLGGRFDLSYLPHNGEALRFYTRLARLVVPSVSHEEQLR
jgi:hypothetical protein